MTAHADTGQPHDELPPKGSEGDDAERLEPAADETRSDDTQRDDTKSSATLSETEALEVRIAELTDKLKRAEAEFVNETKRIRRKAEDDRRYAIEKVVVDLLPVLDALAGAEGSLGESEAEQRMRTGLDLVVKELGAVIERYGVEEIEALGEPFDPNRHEAITMLESTEVPPQSVCQVLRAGVRAPRTRGPPRPGRGRPAAGGRRHAGSPLTCPPTTTSARRAVTPSSTSRA